ncbi:WD40-repeat-containing domain protein [Hyaloraphidium curvatum]|nr:WD40-repeat-containing domain protein [Hyaloraphidium curvatum]
MEVAPGTNPALLSALPPDTPLPLAADRSPAFRIVVGSYERFLYGIDAAWAEDGDKGEDGAEGASNDDDGGAEGAKHRALSPSGLPRLTLHPLFIHPAHTSCIKALALHPSGLLASGSTDETIRLHSLPRKKELGTLLAQRGTITALRFHGNHLVSAAEDGSVAVYRRKDWECVKELDSGKKKEGAGVRDLAVHPSGRLALGIGADHALRLWDLTSGRLTLTLPLPKPHTPLNLPDRVLFSASGDRYLLLYQNRMEVHDLFPSAEGSGKTLIDAPPRVKLTCAAFLPRGPGIEPPADLVVGTESGHLLFYDLASPGAPKAEFRDHPGRVKLVEPLAVPHPSEPGGVLQLLITAASTGIVHVRALPVEGGEPAPLAAYPTRFRPTCMVAGVAGAKPIEVPVVGAEEKKSKREEKREMWERKMKERGAGGKRKAEEGAEAPANKRAAGEKQGPKAAPAAPQAKGKPTSKPAKGSEKDSVPLAGKKEAGKKQAKGPGSGASGAAKAGLAAPQKPKPKAKMSIRS